MNSLQVIGDADTVLAFALGGVAGTVVHTAEEARAAVGAVVTTVRHAGGPVRQPALLLVTYGTAARIRDYLDGVSLDPNGPLILEIPGVGDPPARGRVDSVVERVLGVHP